MNFSSMSDVYHDVFHYKSTYHHFCGGGMILIGMETVGYIINGYRMCCEVCNVGSPLKRSLNLANAM